MNMSRPASLLTYTVVLAFLLTATGCSKLNANARSANPAVSPLQYIDMWGVKGDEPGHLYSPTSIATDPLGNVFIADAGSHYIHKFAPQGTPLLSFQDDWLRSPQSIAVDRGGAIYTADAARASVSIFLPSGDRYRDFKLRSRPNEEDVLRVTVSDDGQIFVLDTGAGQVFSYTSRFRLVQTWRPLANARDARSRPSAIAAGPDGNVYVLDASESRIIKFTQEGHVVTEILVKLQGSGRKLGYEFAVSNGYIFVMDGDGLTLHVLTSDGQPKLDTDLSPQLGQTNRFVPALAVSSHHELFVLDTPDSHVLRYRINF
jgi:DNA-binding beta-propeller fold protein YncE